MTKTDKSSSKNKKNKIKKGDHFEENKSLFFPVLVNKPSVLKLFEHTL